MNYIFAILFTILCFESYSQNVGINTTNPTEKLDVNGNINLTGTIKTNGVDGLANQVLMKDNAGSLKWSDLSNYKNVSSFYADGTFTVPATVSKIAVEIWGGGGGGTTGAGGGGGGYVWAQLNVSPGQNVNITIGVGGTGGYMANATGGGASSVNINGTTISAYGGAGASWVSLSTNFVGPGGSYPTNIPGFNSYYGVAGSNGEPTQRSGYQYNATSFYEIVQGGAGGFAYKAQSASGQGNNLVIETTSGTLITGTVGKNEGNIPGGGGAGGVSSSFSQGAGAQGGRGMVLVYY